MQLASWIDINRIPLTKLNLIELETVAPYLHHVDCRGLDVDERFISLFTKASHLLIKSDKLEKLENLPRGLQTLECSGSQLQDICCEKHPALTSLSVREAPRLQRIMCGNCLALTALSLLEAPELERLDYNDCSALTSISLPDTPKLKDIIGLRCSALASITFVNAPLLRSFSSQDCPNLRTLPLCIGQCARIYHIDIDNTGIDRSFFAAMMTQCRLMRDAEAADFLPVSLAKWKALAKFDVELDVSVLSHAQKMTLNEWLLRLERTKDFVHSQTRLATTVCNILADLLKNKEFQELFFSQAEANNACCEDRAAMSLNEIYTSWMVMCKSGDLQILTGVAKTLRLRKELQKLIGDEGESVEIFLYYESTLRERLGLETAIQNMTYGTIGKRDWINEDKLVEDVEAHFFDELIELPVFEKMIVFDDFSDKLEALGECPKGDPNDPQVLNYQHRQGVIMQEWKRDKIRFAKQWYKENI